MKPKTTTEWRMAPEHRERLRALCDAVADDATDYDPRLLELLDYWREVRGPYGTFPIVGAYFCGDGGPGHWFVGDRAASIVTTIRTFVDSDAETGQRPR